MINKFISELEKTLKSHNVESDDIITKYRELSDKYISLGQSEFDIVRHFGEPKNIVDNYINTGNLDLPNMDAQIDFEMPEFLKEKDIEDEEIIVPVKEINNAPTTRAGLIMNDIFFVGLGLVFAIAGVIALTTVSLLMTASSVVQLKAVWDLATKAQQIGGFFLALLTLAMCAFFFYVVVWIIKTVVKFMKKYAKDHKENWNKCA